MNFQKTLLVNYAYKKSEDYLKKCQKNWGLYINLKLYGSCKLN